VEALGDGEEAGEKFIRLNGLSRDSQGSALYLGYATILLPSAGHRPCKPEHESTLGTIPRAEIDLRNVTFFTNIPLGAPVTEYPTF
jgi:hypothetical protein